MLILCILTQIKEINPNETVEIETITRKEIEYILLTKEEPLSFTVEGPTHIRVYTRILWPAGDEGSKIYKVILQENEIDEKIIALETQVSRVTTDKKGRPVSKWRSFYIDIREGSNKYKIIHWLSPKDTILVKFTYASPEKWQDIPATDYSDMIETIEEERFIQYYELKMGEQLMLRIKGPSRLKVIVRLNYNRNIKGDQNYMILVEDNERLEKFHLKCYKSEVIAYKDRKDIIPSNARTFYIELKEGWHNLKFDFAGTAAMSVSLRFQTKE